MAHGCRCRRNDGPSLRLRAQPEQHRWAIVAVKRPRAKGGGYLQRMEIINLGQADGLPPVDWAAIASKLEAGSAPAADALNSRTTWLATVNEDGTPHLTAVGALWADGAFWFQTGAGTRKGRNARAIRGVQSRCRSATRTSWSKVTRSG